MDDGHNFKRKLRDFTFSLIGYFKKIVKFELFVRYMFDETFYLKEMLIHDFYED